jgi:hypothetical protein
MRPAHSGVMAVARSLILSPNGERAEPIAQQWDGEAPRDRQGAPTRHTAERGAAADAASTLAPLAAPLTLPSPRGERVWKERERVGRCR